VGKKEEDQRRLSAWSQFPLCLCAQLSFARCFTRHIRHVIGEIHMPLRAALVRPLLHAPHPPCHRGNS